MYRSSRQQRDDQAVAFGWKKLDSLAIPFVLAFFSFSTPVDTVFLFFPLVFSTTVVLLSLISTLFISAAAKAAFSSCSAFRCSSKLEKLSHNSCQHGL